MITFCGLNPHRKRYATLIRFPKYRNKRVSHAGYSFASKLEARLFDFLKFREMEGSISDIQNQDHVYLTDARICYIPDFKFYCLITNSWAWAEAKGFETDTWKIKKKLWKYYGPGRLEIYKGSEKKLMLHEEIHPRSNNDDNKPSSKNLGKTAT